jgi:hypothetical protein
MTRTKRVDEDIERQPTLGCITAAEYIIDFGQMDGVSSAFKESLEDMPSEQDAIQALARHINNATGTSELLAALIGVVAIADRRTVEFDTARAAIAKYQGSTQPARSRRTS